jgi:hypothetical protein
VICVYLVVSDAGDTHIFEYVIEKDISGFGVEYAPAHEYIEGHSQIYEEIIQPFPHLFNPTGDKVYYLDYPQYQMDDTHSSRTSLLKWTSPRLKLLNESSTISIDDHSGTRHHGSRGMLPATRYLDDQSFWPSFRKLHPPHNPPQMHSCGPYVRSFWTKGYNS